MITSTVLPSGIVEKIRAGTKRKAQERQLLRVVGYIFRKYLHDGVSFDEPLPISRTHFIKQTRNRKGEENTGYYRDLNALRSLGVIITDHFYKRPLRDPKTGERLALGQCKRHRFAPDLMLTELITVEHRETPERSRINGDWVTLKTNDVLKRLRLSLSKEERHEYIAALVTPEFVRKRLKIGEEIPRGYYKPDGFRRHLERDHLIEIAKASGVELILYNREKIYLADLEEFIEHRAAAIRARYENALNDLAEIRTASKRYCSRNDRNCRLDHNLTTLKKELRELVTLDGEHLVSIDLSNSQFRLLAHLIEIAGQSADTSEHFINFFMRRRNGFLGDLELGDRLKENINRVGNTILALMRNNLHNNSQKISDLTPFIRSTKEGLFYEGIAQAMSAAEGRPITRDDAKKAMFLATFSAHDAQPPEKEILARTYPALVAWIDAFKISAIGIFREQGLSKKEARDLGDAELAVALQNIEALIFVDVILAELLSRGFRCFSIHDSILCKESDAAQVSAIIRDHLDVLLGAGGYQLEEKNLCK